ncbi:MAG TPA: hypothetical protein VIM73_21140 [Polyangiaceae bacterium]
MGERLLPHVHTESERFELRSTPRARFVLALIVCAASGSFSVEARADNSKVPPQVGYNYQEIETPRITATNGAVHALSNSTEALFDNPANMSASRVYHLTAFAQIWPESNRQSYGAAAVDSVGSSTRVGGGLGATYNTQDTDGIDRKWTDIRFALSYPMSDKFYLGVAGRYLMLSQSGQGPLGTSLASAGLAGEKIVRSIGLDAGASFRPTDGLALSIVGSNLNNPGNGFQPMTVAGGIGFGKDLFSLEADVVGDFTTYDRTTTRTMAGGELLLGDHFPLRAGYRYDDGAKSHSVSGGLGYVDTTFSAEIAARRVVSGDKVTAIVFGFTYHLDSAGLTQSETDSF